MVATRIKEIREKKKISQLELAKRVGLSQAEVSRKESGLTSIDVNQLEVFAKALGVPLPDLLVDKTQPPGGDAA